MQDVKAIQTALARAREEKMEENFSFVSPVTLAEGTTKSVIEVLRVGVIQDRMLEITKEYA